MAWQLNLSTRSQHNFSIDMNFSEQKIFFTNYGIGGAMGEDLQLVKQDGDAPTPTGDGNTVRIRKKSGPPRLEVERQRFLRQGSGIGKAPAGFPG